MISSHRRNRLAYSAALLNCPSVVPSARPFQNTTFSFVEASEANKLDAIFIFSQRFLPPSARATVSNPKQRTAWPEIANTSPLLLLSGWLGCRIREEIPFQDSSASHHQPTSAGRAHVRVPQPRIIQSERPGPANPRGSRRLCGLRSRAVPSSLPRRHFNTAGKLDKHYSTPIPRKRVEFNQAIRV
jgi:hypothetical protein